MPFMSNLSIHHAFLTRSAVALTLCLVGFATYAACLPYEPALVTLSGKLERKTFPGRPNFESIANGDEPETGFYLVPSSPICAIGIPGSSNPDTQTNVQLIQLILDQSGYTKLQPLIGKNIRLHGSLQSWVTGHHHTPLLLAFKNIENEHTSQFLGIIKTAPSQKQ